jgi:hypothetical protein
MDEAKQPVKKNVSNDIILVLKAKEGATKDSLGMTDNRMFTGENKLHAIMDTQSTLWHLQYEQGALPPALKGQWTGFKQLHKYATDYYNKRNVEITEVID